MTISIGTIINRAITTHGVNPARVYCASTGWPVGYLNHDELALTLAVMGEDDMESIVDDLVTRTLIAARPSTAWNSLTIHTLDRMRQHAPKQLLAYLLNRLYDTSRMDLRMTLDERVTMVRQRISLANLIDSIPFIPAKLDELLLALLTLDSRYDLTKLKAPKNLPFLVVCLTPEGNEQLLVKLWNWIGRLTLEADNAVKAANLSRSFWNGGNALARTAYASQLDKVAPTKAAIAKKAKTLKFADDVNFLDQLEAELMTRSLEATAEPRSVAQPKSAAAPVKRFATPARVTTSSVKPTRFGGFARKDS